MTDKSTRPTLSGLNARIGNLAKSVEGIAADVEEIKRPKTDFEASVAGRCATALDSLHDRAQSSKSSGYNYALTSSATGSPYAYQPLYAPPASPVARVLDYLRQRYGLPDPATETRRLSAELERAYARMQELEHRLEQIRGATS